jgi:hypothetical protein
MKGKSRRKKSGNWLKSKGKLKSKNNKTLRTKEGVDAVIDVIEYIKTLSPM